MKFERNLLIILALTAVVVGQSTFPFQTSRSQEARRTYQRTGNEGTISGTISFIGRPSRNVIIDKTADPACARINPLGRTEQFVINRGRFSNVLVYVKSAKV